MKIDEIKKETYKIINNGRIECDFIEYKKSIIQKDSIIKTICGFANNYMNRGICYLFIGIEETDNIVYKAIPKRPISGLEEGEIENIENELKHLISYVHPKPKYNIISNSIDGRFYVALAIEPQSYGPFSTSDNAYTEKGIKLKPGRYIRISRDSRLADDSELYDLLKKYKDTHFSSLINDKATINDLNIDHIKEYLSLSSIKDNTIRLSKFEICQSLKLLDLNDSNNERVTNFAVLMFSDNPDKFIPYSYIEVINNINGNFDKMESYLFKGPIWKQIKKVLTYFEDNIIKTYTLRPDGQIENRKVSNYPLSTCDELITNAVTHNNFESAINIQIYIQKNEIIIVNHNKPIPPITYHDLNTLSVFPNRKYENPEIREMFKTIGLIESYGTGIGKAKRAMKSNGSPDIIFEEFNPNIEITSVKIPINYEFYKSDDVVISNHPNENSNQGSLIIKIINDSELSNIIKIKLIKIYEKLNENIFSRIDVINLLNCSRSSASIYLDILKNRLDLITFVEGKGNKFYIFKK